ncbi:hypothetical protein H1C71_020296 [Ictidomys tridecemlineatus]|nr:hypothetical protein H1C71_020296 [Ictidomys tridecemlineatus]
MKPVLISRSWGKKRKCQRLSSICNHITDWGSHTLSVCISFINESPWKDKMHTKQCKMPSVRFQRKSVQRFSKKTENSQGANISRVPENEHWMDVSPWTF